MANKFEDKLEDFLNQLKIADENIRKLLAMGRIDEAEKLKRETDMHINRLTMLLETIDSHQGEFNTAEELHKALKDKPGFFLDKAQEIRSLHFSEQHDAREKT